MLALEIISDRLRLRPSVFSDLDAMHDLLSLPEVDQYNTLGIPKDKIQTESWLKEWLAENELEEVVSYNLSIENRKTAELIGLFGIKVSAQKYRLAEYWYKFHPDHWNKGYATEILREAINYGFDVLKLHRIEAGCAVENIGSVRVMEKAGMKREGRRREILPLKSGWSDCFDYAILETDIRK